MKKKFTNLVSVLIITIAILIGNQSLKAQPMLSLPSWYNLPFGNIAVPVTGSNFVDVGAISLGICYLSASLDYQTYQNVNPNMTSGFLVVNKMPTTGLWDTIRAAWFSLTPLNFASGVLFELTFNYHDCTPLNFDTALTVGFVCQNGYLCNTSGVNNLTASNNQMSLVPNPAGDKVELIFGKESLPDKAQLILIDLNGKEILNQDLEAYTTNKTLNLTNIPAGTYQLNLYNNGRLSCSKKLIITH